MDFAQGGELTEILERGKRLSENKAKEIFKQIYEAVCYIHNNNIIHRDLKPNNILFLDKEKTHLVIIDFGISGVSNGNMKEKIKAGTTMFMAPEMASGEQYASDRKLDIWSLGIILYRMVQGVYPFEGKNTKEIVNNILKSKLEFNKKIRISYALRVLIEGMLEKNHRFRIDNDSPLFKSWFDNSNTENKKVEDKNKNFKRMNSNKSQCNYLTPTKSHVLKRLPTHSYNNLYGKIGNKPQLPINGKEENYIQKFLDKNDNNIFQNFKGIEKINAKKTKSNLILPLIKRENNKSNAFNNFNHNSEISANNLKTMDRSAINNNIGNIISSTNGGGGIFLGRKNNKNISGKNVRPKELIYAINYKSNTNTKHRGSMNIISTNSIAHIPNTNNSVNNSNNNAEEINKTGISDNNENKIKSKSKVKLNKKNSISKKIYFSDDSEENDSVNEKEDKKELIEFEINSIK